MLKVVCLLEQKSKENTESAFHGLISQQVIEDFPDDFSSCQKHLQAID